MHISELYIFNKDTDASDIQRGYEYQKLRTLEAWLQNKVEGLDEVIYCDFEEDIFQRDLSLYKSKFRQVKLYSSKNFSFSSVEVKKGIAHFFMLFVNPEYLFDEPQFIFETNSSVAREYRDNDAKLLAEWHLKQESLESELLKKCIDKVKSIVSQYIDERIKDFSSATDPKEQKAVESAKKLFDDLKNETWEAFVRSIKWSFSAESPEQALQQCTASIYELIAKLPFPLSNEDYDKVFSVLYREVGERSIDPLPELRCLTKLGLDEQLLKLGSKSDQAYQEAFSLWKDVETVGRFNVGEFYEVLHSSNHCRKNTYLESHSSTWLSLLNEYISLDGTIPYCRHEAIYELVWATLRPSFPETFGNPLHGLEELVKDYFQDLSKYPNSQSIENALNLATILYAATKLDLINLSEELIVNWFDQIEAIVQQSLDKSTEPFEKCSLLEVMGFLRMHQRQYGFRQLKISEVMEPFEKILELLNESPQYPVSQLGNQIDSIVKILIRTGHDNDATRKLESYAENLQPHIQKREGNYSAAQRYVELGGNYLKSADPTHILKAIDYFHRAKDLWYQNETIEGYVLGALSIAQLYASLGMGLASKYYGLCGVWVGFNSGKTGIFKRIADSYSLIIQADFQQGAWISALQDLERYFVARREFDPNPMDVIEDAIYRESLFNAALIIAAAPKVSSQVYGYIEYIKSQMGDFFDSELAHLVDEVNRTIDEMGLDTLLNAKLLSSPFSDLGAQRTIDWKALGVQWKVTFDNDFVTNSVAEEFCAFMQIIQVELALTKTDLHLIGNTMNFSVSLSNEIKEPVVIRHNRGEYEWRLFLPVLDNDAKDFRMHNAQMSTTVQFVLNLISLLPKEEFKGIYFKLFENNGLAQKTVSANSYQRMYRRLVDQKQFEEAQRSNFESVDHPVLLSQHPALNAEDSLSPKYDQEAAKDRIRIRYEKSLKPIQITFDKLIKDEKFHDLVRQLRKDGWLDWQILMSLTNAVCNYKANLLVQGKQYVTHESFAKDFNKGFQSFFDEEESLSNYVDIPFEEIRSDLKHQLELLSIHVLPSFDLESKSEKPDVKGIKEMLQKRFNFMTDDTSGENPLAVIST